MYWTFIAYFTYNSENIENFKPLFYISISGLFIFLPVQNLFVKNLTGKITPLYILAVVLPACFLAVKNVDGSVTFADFLKTADGWVFVPPQHSIWNIMWKLYMTAAYGSGLLFLAKRYRETELNRERKQMFLLMATSTLSMILSFSDYFFYERLLWLRTVPLTPVLLLPWASGYVAAIKHYQFLKITPENVTRHILEVVDEFVILIDFDGKPAYLNAKALSLFNGNPHTTGRIDIDSFLPSVLDDRSIKKRIALTSTENGMQFPVLDLEISKVNDKFGDPLGYLLIGKEVKSLEIFRIEYKLTDREMDIVGAVINGWKTQIIAAQLKITERTVKSHISSIYRKLSITNRVELLNLIFQAEC
jgi:DNA-binding CsgD family transcriptional regulator